MLGSPYRPGRRPLYPARVPSVPVPDAVGEFLARPNPAVVATLRPDGFPHTAATWYVWDGGRVLVNMAASRRRLRHLREDPRVSVTVMGAGDEWYRQITLRGRATEIAPDPDLAGIDRVSRQYTGRPYRRRDQERVNAWIEVSHWYGWNGGAPWTGGG
jgi:PPOX class probable F420-dependent enzyme